LQKIKILCSVIAGRERVPRRIAIPGLNEVHPQVVEDLHPQAEASAEAQARTGVPAIHLIKAEMGKAAPAVHLTITEIAKDQLVVRSIN
jgi:sorbitol-specific phosphotransferase system component IIBC